MVAQVEEGLEMEDCARGDPRRVMTRRETGQWMSVVRMEQKTMTRDGAGTYGM